ncbi:RHS repeat-associated core domain-containing protein [Streptomyces sp. NPDC015125]|uniref:RHS repeat-associated core domain-containing protein n=1 Tax=Streptomyces sp. NPDC015125 TaxID=3364938 RepID=UPI003700F181
MRFPGQYFDAETGLHYNFHRYYDPETAHYITPDPLGLAPTPNPSAYVHNPHGWTDPLGLTPCEVGNDGQRPPRYPSIVLGVNPPSDMLAEHLRNNGHPDAQTFNGPRYANVEAGTPVWMSNVMGGVSDPRVDLHITLDGMPGAGSTPESISEAFEVAAKRGRPWGTGTGQEHPPSKYGTAWEMSVIARNVRAFNTGQAEGEDYGGRSWDSIHWYSGNQRVHNVPEPESVRYQGG